MSVQNAIYSGVVANLELKKGSEVLFSPLPFLPFPVLPSLSLLSFPYPFLFPPLAYPPVLSPLPSLRRRLP